MGQAARPGAEASPPTVALSPSWESPVAIPNFGCRPQALWAIVIHRPPNGVPVVRREAPAQLSFATLRANQALTSVGQRRRTRDEFPAESEPNRTQSCDFCSPWAGRRRLCGGKLLTYSLIWILQNKPNFHRILRNACQTERTGLQRASRQTAQRYPRRSLSGG